MQLHKDKRKAHHSSDNYRVLTIGTIIGMLCDVFIINQQTGVVDTSDLLFGYKDGLSTTMSTFMVKETISHYVNNGSTVHDLFISLLTSFKQVQCLIVALVLMHDIDSCLK